MKKFFIITTIGFSLTAFAKNPERKVASTIEGYQWLKVEHSGMAGMSNDKKMALHADIASEICGNAKAVQIGQWDEQFGGECTLQLTDSVLMKCSVGRHQSGACEIGLKK